MSSSRYLIILAYTFLFNGGHLLAVVAWHVAPTPGQILVANYAAGHSFANTLRDVSLIWSVCTVFLFILNPVVFTTVYLLRNRFPFARRLDIIGITAGWLMGSLLFVLLFVLMGDSHYYDWISD